MREVEIREVKRSRGGVIEGGVHGTHWTYWTDGMDEITAHSAALRAGLAALLAMADAEVGGT